MWNKTRGWKEIFLSLAGKEVLIKSVLWSFPSYVMSVFLLEKMVTNEITSLIRNFSGLE